MCLVLVPTSLAQHSHSYGMDSEIPELHCHLQSYTPDMSIGLDLDWTGTGLLRILLILDWTGLQNAPKI